MHCTRKGNSLNDKELDTIVPQSRKVKAGESWLPAQTTQVSQHRNLDGEIIDAAFHSKHKPHIEHWKS